MNILYHLHHPPSGFVLTELRALSNRGHNIAVFVMNKPDESESVNTDGIDIPMYYSDSSSITDITSLISSDISTGMIKELFFPTHPKYHLWTLHQSLQCIKFVKTLKFDIELIHGHFATRAKLSAALTGRYLNVPVTVTGHAADIFVKDPDWLKIILNRMDHVITISEYNSDYLTNNIGICTPVDSIHLGVDVKKFTPHNQDGMTQTIVSVSRLTEKKGLMYNLRAVNQLTDKYPELTYNVIGEGQREDKLRRIISRYGLTDSVKLLGHVSDERLETEIANASMFVLPCVKTDNGNRDGIPVSLMEAMAMETTPISTRISGVPELITHEESGLLIEPRNAEQLAEGISTLIEDPQYRKELGQAARQKIIAEFNLKTQTKELETIFKRVTRSYQN